MLPELVGVCIFVFVLIIVVFSLPELAVLYLEGSGKLATYEGVYALRLIFLAWIIVCALTGWFDFRICHNNTTHTHIAIEIFP